MASIVSISQSGKLHLTVEASLVALYELAAVPLHALKAWGDVSRLMKTAIDRERCNSSPLS